MATTLVLASTEKAREAILASMEDKTRLLAVEGGEKLKKLHAAGILLFYDLGKLIHEVSTDETIDGEGEITKLAQYWGIDNTNKLYEWKNTALTYTREFLAEQAREPLPNGKEITFEHFKALRKIADEKKRDSYLKKARKESWSANELVAEIRATGSVKTKRQGGRNPSIPSSAAAIVKKCHTLSQQLYRYLGAVSTEAENRFKELPADEASHSLLEGMTDAIDMLNSVINEVVSFDTVLKSGRDRVHTILTGTQAAEAEEATDNVFDAIIGDSAAIEDNRADVMEGPQATIEDLRERTVAITTTAAKQRGRPTGSKNKPSDETAVVGKKKRGRPRGSKNKKSSTD